MEQFTLEDLAMAYRKAKVDVYYSANPRRLDLLAYESDLEANLSDLLDRLNGDGDAWVTDPEFLGSAYLMPKSVKDSREQSKSRWSDPRKNWNARITDASKADLGFRVMALCSIDLHVLSSLWVAKVGALLEAELSENSRGNRLRRTGDGQFNSWASGSFGPYLHPYRQWRDLGMTAARDALKADRDVVVISADVASYYHSLDPKFMVDKDFLKLFEAELPLAARRLHRLFVSALDAWPQVATEALGFKVSGLPVGLPVAGVVANLALIEFDRLVEAEVRPLYYGRYVDDLLIVLTDVGDGAAFDVWKWLEARLDGILEIKGDQQRIGRSYLGGSVIELSAEKSMMLHLSGKSGLALIGSIERTIHARSSEWRSLPSLPDDPQEIVTDIAQVFQADGDLADSFRTVDLMTARRSAFALRLRDYEAYEADLNPESWAPQREAFYEAIIDYALTVPGCFELAPYTMRVMKLAAASGDLDAVERMIRSLIGVREVIVASPRVTVKGAVSRELSSRGVAKKWALGVARQIAEVVTCAVPAESDAEAIARINEALVLLTGSREATLVADDLLGLSQALTEADLGHRPYRSRFMNTESTEVALPTTDALEAPSNAALLPKELNRRLQSLVQVIRGAPVSDRRGRHTVPNAIAYATRPFGLLELFILARPDIEDTGRFSTVVRRVRDAVLAQRGYDAKDMLPRLDAIAPSELIVPRAKPSTSKRIAVAMVRTSGSSWSAAAIGTPDLTPSRHKALSDTINEILRSPRGVDYLTLPELSVPRRWFVRFAHKLRSQNIGLIAGVEYLQGPDKTVHNQVWASLPLEGSEFPGTYLYRQDKMTPAIHESHDLAVVAGRRLEAERKWTRVPLIRHGDFAFALLICSELTNIDYRAQLRGRVDAMFLPAWNKDLNTFNALVEATALDIHAYVVLTNDRVFGDSRIRAPKKNDWERDIVRLRGGVENYVVVTEIDVEALRAHHNTERPDGPVFKPLPDGFKVDRARQGRSLGPRGL